MDLWILVEGWCSGTSRDRPADPTRPRSKPSRPHHIRNPPKTPPGKQSFITPIFSTPTRQSTLNVAFGLLATDPRAISHSLKGKRAPNHLSPSPTYLNPVLPFLLSILFLFPSFPVTTASSTFSPPPLHQKTPSSIEFYHPIKFIHFINILL